MNNKPPQVIIIYNATLAQGGEMYHGWVQVDGGIIAATGRGDVPAGVMDRATVAVDCRGDVLMPGVIDTHVHMRDPGLTAKGDIATETLAARAGGVTSVIDMPNTRPATVTPGAWEEKMAMAAAKAWVNYAFWIGATADNLQLMHSLDLTRVPGIKLFLGSSTGNMLLDDDKALETLFDGQRALVAVHAEDEATIAAARASLIARYGPGNPIPVWEHSRLRPVEACTLATARILDIASRHGARLHLLHVSTAREVEMARGIPGVTLETCPQYLFHNSGDLKTHGARLKCNPAIKGEGERRALLEALQRGDIDTVATDHAPHLLQDKEGDVLQAASGMPSLQFALPLMLTHSGLDAAGVATLMSHNPARIMGIERRGHIKEGYHADLVRVRHLDTPHTIADSDVVSRCGWTPWAGTPVEWQVMTTWVNGHAVHRAAQPLSFAPEGQLSVER